MAKYRILLKKISHFIDTMKKNPYLYTVNRKNDLIYLFL